MQVPSGRLFDDLDLDIIRLMHMYGFVRYREEPFRLKSGILSHFYVHGRDDLTDHPDFEWLIGRRIALVVQHVLDLNGRPVCLIGLPSAGTPLAQAASMVSFAERIHIAGKPICHRIMKEQRKLHGAHQGWVNGEPTHELRFCTIDNVVTDGKTKIEAADRLAESGYAGREMPSFIFVDREQGALPWLQKEGFRRVTVLYTIREICFALRELGLWDASVVDKIEGEIDSHEML